MYIFRGGGVRTILLMFHESVVKVLRPMGGSGWGNTLVDLGEVGIFTFGLLFI